MKFHAIFSVAALFGVAIFYVVLELLPGNATYQYLFLDSIAFSSVASAFSSSLLVQRIGWWPVSGNDWRTGALRGAIVVSVAHSLFGVYLIVWSEIESLFRDHIASFSLWHTMYSMLVGSITSLLGLPTTLITGCLAGILAEKQLHRSGG